MAIMSMTRCWRAAVVGCAMVVAVCAAGTAEAATPNPIIVQPNPVAPGGFISVFDGGNCDFPATGTVTFQGSGSGSVTIPPISISPLQNMIGGSGQVPANATPGSYQVSLTCKTGGKSQGPFTGTLTVQSGASTGVNPTGGAKTGDGASLGKPGGLASGIALIVIGGGAWFLLRRKRLSS